MMRWIRIWMAVALCAMATGYAQSTTVHQEGDRIVGVSGVVSGGVIYNVEFRDGSCLSLFAGCDTPGDFVFADVQVAADAVFWLMQGALSGVSTPPIRGCSNSYPCTVYTPFSTPYAYFSAREGGWSEARFVFNRRETPNLSAGGYTDLLLDHDTSLRADETFVIFSPVPEAPAWAMLPAGLLLLGVARRVWRASIRHA